MSSAMIMRSELASILEVSIQALNKRAKKENWPHANGGNRARPFIITSLPPDIQTAIVEKTAVPRSLLPALSPEAALVAAKRTAEVPGIIQGPKDVPLMDWQKKKALAWADLIRLYIIYVAKHGGTWGKTGQVKDDFALAYNAGAYPYIYKVLGKSSVKSLDRKVGDLKKADNDAFVAFAPKHGGNRGKRSIGQEQAQIILSVVRSPYNPRKLSEIIRISRTIMGQRNLEDGLSDATYRRWLQEWVGRHYDDWVFWTEGEKGLNDKCSYWIERDYDKIDVGDVLVADGHVLNFDILNPWTGKPKRMILILWLDMKSSYPLGWEIMPTENTQAINAALRRAIMRLGKLPLVAYLDNGKAFAGRFFNGANLEEAGFSGVYERLGIRTVFAWPYHGQSKTVERFFGSFAELERMSPSYVGTSIALKPPRLNRGEKLHRRIHEKITAGRVPTLIEAHQAIAAWFDDWVRRPHVGGHLKGISSHEVFEAGRGPGVDSDGLRFLMLSQEIRTIRRNGIRFFGKWYYHPALYGRKHTVDIRFDIEDPNHILVYEPNSDQLICTATPPPKVHPAARILGTEADKALLEEQIEFKRGLEKRTTGSARAFLNAEMIPEVQRQIESRGFEIKDAGSRMQDAGSRMQDAERTKKKVVALVLSEAEKSKIEDDLRTLERANQGTGHIAWDKLPELADMDRYEKLLEYEAQGVFVPKDEQGFMRFFEQTEQYTRFAEYFETYRTKMTLMYQTV